MGDKSFKAWERRVCGWFGGLRRGPVMGMLHTNDCVGTPGYSVEVKLLSRPSFGDLLAATKQSEVAKEHPDDIAIAVVKKKYADDSDALVIMRRDEFISNFVGGIDE